MTTEPQLPFRIDLDAWLRAEGREAEADTIYACACGAHAHSTAFIDVRDRPDLFAGNPFVCSVCASDLQRRETVQWEADHRAWLAAQGQLDEETLNGLRNRRDTLLRATDHTQLADYRETMGEEAYQQVTAYRAQVRAWFATARDTGVVGDLPTPPG